MFKSLSSLNKKKTKPESLTSYHSLATVYPSFQFLKTEVCTYSISSFSFVQFTALWLLPLFSADTDHIMGIQAFGIAKFNGYFFALNLLEIFAAFDAVDHLFLLESLSSLGFLP